MLPGCYKTPNAMQPWELGLVGADVVRIASAIDQLGFEGVLIPEHLLVSAKHTRGVGTHFFDAMTAQALIAGATEHIQVGSMITILPLHDPIALAKAVATADWLSGGRITLGVGLGWQQAEYEALEVPWNRRGAITDEYLAAMIELWTSKVPEFSGEFIDFSDIRFDPKPVHGRPAIWIGGDSDAALRRAARFGDCWAPWQTPPSEIPAKVARIREMPGFDSRSMGVFYSVMALQMPMRDGHHVRGEPQQDRRSLNVEKTIDNCGYLSSLGVTDTWVPPPIVDSIDEYLEAVQVVAAEVMPAVKAMPVGRN